METSIENRGHLGQKIARIRELRGMKQEVLAEELGISQQGVSNLEQSESLADEKLEKVAKALGVTKEAIENFSEEKAINYFSNFNDHSINHGNNSFCTFNPLEKLLEVVEKNEKLYERLVQAEKEKVQYLERMLQNYKQQS